MTVVSNPHDLPHQTAGLQLIDKFTGSRLSMAAMLSVARTHVIKGTGDEPNKIFRLKGLKSLRIRVFLNSTIPLMVTICFLSSVGSTGL